MMDAMDAFLLLCFCFSFFLVRMDIEMEMAGFCYCSCGPSFSQNRIRSAFVTWHYIFFFLPPG